MTKTPTRYESVGCDEENFSFPEECSLLPCLPDEDSQRLYEDENEYTKPSTLNTKLYTKLSHTEPLGRWPKGKAIRTRFASAGHPGESIFVEHELP